MKKTITLSVLSSILLMAGSPIHDLMDNRIKGKSYTGSLDDNVAASDGLGVLPLQHHTGTTEMNNELLVQKVFNRIVKSETDKTKTVNIKDSLSNGLVGTSTDNTILNNVGFILKAPVVVTSEFITTLNSGLSNGQTFSFPKANYQHDSLSQAGDRFRGSLITVDNSNVTVDFNDSSIELKNLASYAVYGMSAVNSNGSRLQNLNLKLSGSSWVLFETSYNHGYGSANNYYDNVVIDARNLSFSYIGYSNGGTVSMNNVIIILKDNQSYNNVYVNRGSISGYRVIRESTAEAQNLLNTKFSAFK